MKALITFMLIAITAMSYAQKKPSQMSTATINSFKTVLDIDSIENVLVDKLDTTSADLRYLKASEGFNLSDSVYFKPKVDSVAVAKADSVKGTIQVNPLYQLNSVYGFDSATIFPVGASINQEVSITMADGQVNGCTFIISKTTVITGVCYVVQTGSTGAVLDNQNGFRLVKMTGTSSIGWPVEGSVIAFPDNTAWTIGRKYYAFTTPLTLEPGEYKGELIFNVAAGTSPQLMTFGRPSSLEYLMFNYLNHLSYKRNGLSEFAGNFDANSSLKDDIPFIYLK